MLTKEIMGLFALGVLWLNGALVLAVAWKQLRAIGVEVYDRDAGNHRN